MGRKAPYSHTINEYHFDELYSSSPRAKLTRVLQPSRVFYALANLVQSLIELPKLARRRWRWQFGFLLSLRFSSGGSISTSRRRSSRGVQPRCTLRRDALQVLLPHFSRGGIHARLLRTPDPHQPLEEVSHRHAQDDVPVTRCERDEEGARDQGACRRAWGVGWRRRRRRGAVRVVEEEDEGRVSQGGEP
jgi:hypothetical protein